MERCVYCGRKIEEEKPLAAKAHTRTFPVCSEPCKAGTEQYVVRDKKYKMRLYMVIFVAALAILGTLVFERDMRLMYGVQVIFGIAFFLMPYPITSFESFQSCPIKVVVRICQGVGIAFAVFGLYLLLAL